MQIILTSLFRSCLARPGLGTLRSLEKDLDPLLNILAHGNRPVDVQFLIFLKCCRAYVRLFSNPPNALIFCPKASTLQLNSNTYVCVFSHLPNNQAFYVAPIIVYELLLFGLATYRSGIHLRDAIKAGRWGYQSLATTIFTDSLIYFIVCVSSWSPPGILIQRICISAASIYTATLIVTRVRLVSHRCP
jgi:hypothetical protein